MRFRRFFHSHGNEMGMSQDCPGNVLGTKKMQKISEKMLDFQKYFAEKVKAKLKK